MWFGPHGVLCLPPREQARLKARVVLGDTEAWQRDPDFSGLRRVGGVDVSFAQGDGGLACASLVVLSYPELEVTLRSPSPWARPRDNPAGGVYGVRAEGGLCAEQPATPGPVPCQAPPPPARPPLWPCPPPGSTLSWPPQASAGIIDSRKA